MESITALNNGLIKFPGVLLFSSRDHQIVQTTQTESSRSCRMVPLSTRSLPTMNIWKAMRWQEKELFTATVKKTKTITKIENFCITKIPLWIISREVFLLRHLFVIPFDFFHGILHDAVAFCHSIVTGVHRHDRNAACYASLTLSSAQRTCGPTSTMSASSLS